MQVEVLKSKIHRAVVTNVNLDYIGSITIDETLMNAANLIPGEKVQVLNLKNGERIETYIIKGLANSGEIIINGPAAKRFNVDDKIIIIGYGLMDFEKAKAYIPSIIFPNEADNQLK